MKRLLGALVFFCCVAPAWSAPPVVEIATAPLGLVAGRVPPNLLINLSLTHAAAGAAYPGSFDYARATTYSGYFNPAMCYRYPTKGGVPDSVDATAYFSIVRGADSRHECGGAAFSGNFMNWASAAQLDIVRYGLSGGDRVIDAVGHTVLQRAWLPDGKVNPDFYAHPVYFPRKVLDANGNAADSGSAPSQVTPFDTPLLYIVSCRNRILFSNTADGGTCDAPRGDDHFGQFLARVQVCDLIDAPLRPDLCRRYGSGYKPVGALQRHAGQLRFGLMAYLTENSASAPDPYGGALRAVMGFIGPQASNAPDFLTTPNGHAEWNAGSGVLAAAPGGLITYLNRLGRNQPSNAGVYARANPLAELYYEGVRYLQGRQPSPGVPNPSSGDGAAIVAPWREPSINACQRQVVLTIGNASPIEDRYVPGNGDSSHLDAARPGDVFGLTRLDAVDWTRRIGEIEADASGSHGNPARRSGLAGLESQQIGEGGRGSYYAAGLAYWAHVNPVRPDKAFKLENIVIDLDAGGNGDARDSVLYLAAKYGGFHDRNLDGALFRTSLPGAAEASPDDVEWTGGGSDPAHYFRGGDPAALLAGLRAAFDAQAAGVAPGRMTTQILMAAPDPGVDTYLFQSESDLTDGAGSLSRHAVTFDVNGGARLGKRLWDAARLLGGDQSVIPPLAPTPAPAARHLYTFDKDGSPATMPLEWGRLSAAQRALLDLAPAGDGAAPRSDGLGQARLAYLRGERDREAGQPDGIFRRRNSLLGATLYGKPLYVGAPSASIGGASYAAFYASVQARRKMLYMGSGDGLLHAFDAASGLERHAYLPAALLSKVSRMASAHSDRVPLFDGSAASAEALLGGRWRSVLVSGMGASAQGVFALDVSDPDRFDSDGALWEFTDLDDPAIGNLMAAPMIAKVRTSGKQGAPVYRYFAILGSGLDNHVDDGKGRFVASANGALLLLALDKPPEAKWQLGVNYYKLVLPVSEAGMANGVGAPALVAGTDGAVRLVYVGDLQGNLWRIDLTAKAPWNDAVGKPWFVARDSAGRRQPISQQPKVVFAPGGGYVVLFGTGKWIEPSDAVPSSFATQSFYAVHDGLDERPAGVRAALLERVLTGAVGAADGFAITGEVFTYTGAAGSQGWYLDFPHAALSGERSISNATLAGGKVFFNTVLPGSDPCVAAGARAYALDSLYGFAIDANGVPASGALGGTYLDTEIRAPPVVWELAAKVGPRDASGRAIVEKTLLLLQPGRLGAGVNGAAPGAPLKTRVGLPARRLSWREVANWRELHDAAKK